MKFFHTYIDYKISQKYIQRIQEAKSHNEIDLILNEINEQQLNEVIGKFIKKFTKGIASIGKNINYALDYFVTGKDPDKIEPAIEIEPTVYDQEILLVYKEPLGQVNDVFMIHNGYNVTNSRVDFTKTFYSFSLGINLKNNLVQTDTLRISKYKNRNTDLHSEYVITLYSLLDDAEGLYNVGTDIEELSPSITVYLKHLKPNFKSDVKKQYAKLLKLPKFYDKKQHAEFEPKILIDALGKIEYDLEENK